MEKEIKKELDSFVNMGKEEFEREKDYFVNKGYERGGIIMDSKFSRRFMILYRGLEEDIVGFVSRLASEGEMNYSLHILKLIDDKNTGINKKWWTIRDFIEIPKESKLGRDLVELENQGAFKNAN